MKLSVLLTWLMVLFKMCLNANDIPDIHCKEKNLSDQNSVLPDSSAYTINEANFSGKVVLKRMKHLPGYALELYSSDGNLLDHMMLRRKLYQFTVGDIDGDGKTDICIGIIKKTTFHPHVGKRLFIYRIFEDKIWRMWMGSQVTRSLIDFRVVRNNQRASEIVTIEKDKNGKYYIGLYHWSEFGLQLSCYRQRNISYTLARRELAHENK